MMMTTHFHLALTIRMCGATPPFFKFFTTPLSIKDRDSFPLLKLLTIYMKFEVSTSVIMKTTE